MLKLTLAECCSAASPCNHQKRDPHSVCKACQDAYDLNLRQAAALYNETMKTP
jgi:hypothetical protein